MILTSILLFLSLLFLSYGIYLLAIMNKDISNNNMLPQYIKDHMKASGIIFTSVGAVGVVLLGLSLTKKMSSSGMGDMGGNDMSNFGFKFY